MIKIWKGIEQEAVDESSQVMTMFICSDLLLDGNFIVDMLMNNLDVQAIYFGAGRTAFSSIIHWNMLVDYCSLNNISIFIEINEHNYKMYINRFPQATFIFSLYDMPKNVNIRFKTDDWRSVKLFTLSTEVDITEVQNDRYPNDTVIFEEG